MVSRNAELPQGDGGMISATSFAADQLRSRAGNDTVFKSGPLFISSKALGWTSWKKRWFILTRTSLVFFRSDPNALPQKGSEVNLTLGGIDLNSSGSVIVRADKKLLTVLFPDGRNGRAFTLKAETSEDLYEWKTALENALAQAPNAMLVMGQTGILRNDVADAVEGTSDQWHKRPVKSLVVGRPILLALEDIDGSPSFLEKALRFIEECGIKVEGILRQAADVEEVKRRVREYEQGKDEFSPDDDAHVVADCIKHILRELPTSPVPAACCTALLEAFRSERALRINAMRSVVFDKFPEPNRRLLQRILKMMCTIVAHKSENRMSTSAVAACMAPLLLRPLLAGDCQFEDDFQMGGDGSLQLLQAAAAANHAQAIIITLLEEYHYIFSDASYTSEIYSDSEGSYNEDEEYTDDEILEDDEYDDQDNDLYSDSEDDPERQMSGRYSGSSGDEDTDSEYSKENTSSSNTHLQSVTAKSSLPLDVVSPEPLENIQVSASTTHQCHSQSQASSSLASSEVCEASNTKSSLKAPHSKGRGLNKSSSINKSIKKPNDGTIAKKPAIWGRTAAKKNLSMEALEFPSEDEVVIHKLEISKADLEKKIMLEAEENALLQENLERRRKALHERRLALEEEVVRLQEQLQRERDLGAALKAGLGILTGPPPDASNVETKTRAKLEEVAVAEADVANLKEKVSDLHQQLNQERQNNDSSNVTHCGQDGHISKDVMTQNHENDFDYPPKSEDILLGADCKNIFEHEIPFSSNMGPIEKQQRVSSQDSILAEPYLDLAKEKLPASVHQTYSFDTNLNGPRSSELSVSPTHEQSQQRQFELAAGPKITENANSAVPTADPSNTSKSKSANNFDTNSPKSLELSVSLKHKQSQQQQESGLATDPPSVEKAKYAVCADDSSSTSKSKSSEPTTELSNVSNLKSAVLTSNPLSVDILKSAEDTSDLSSVSSTSDNEPTSDPSSVNNPKSVELTTVFLSKKNLKSAEDTSNLSSVSSTSVGEPTSDPLRLSNPKSAEHSIVLSRNKNLISSEDTSNFSSVRSISVAEPTSDPLSLDNSNSAELTTVLSSKKKLKSVEDTSELSSVSGTSFVELTSDPSNLNNPESAELMTVLSSKKKLKSAEDTSELSSVSSTSFVELISDPSNLNNPESAELMTVLSSKKNLESAEDTSDLSSASRTSVAELNSDPSSLNDPKSAKLTTVLSSKKNSKSAELTDVLSSKQDLKSAVSTITSLIEELPPKNNQTDPSGVKGPESIVQTVNSRSEDQKISTNEMQPNGMAQDQPSSTNKLPPKNNQADSSGVNSLKQTTYDTENDPPSSTNELSHASLSSNSSCTKSMECLPGSTSDGSLPVVRNASSEKSTEASKSLSKEPLAVKPAVASKKSRGSSSRLSNDDSSTVAAGASSKKPAGKEGNSSTMFRLTNRFNLKKDRRSKSVDLQSFEPPSEAPVPDVPVPPAPPKTNS
ncbi:uncharacterized protein [Aristolochia californica]|uniref:uncharacterized protein isoform X2 n=1 Tax=Aristolochia californica TaxID=171875 RepID=UPI0035DFA136